MPCVVHAFIGQPCERHLPLVISPCSLGMNTIPVCLYAREMYVAALWVNTDMV